jgi:hypothetical protein
MNCFAVTEPTEKTEDTEILKRGFHLFKKERGLE